MYCFLLFCTTSACHPPHLVSSRRVGVSIRTGKLWYFGTRVCTNSVFHMPHELQCSRTQNSLIPLIAPAHTRHNYTHMPSAGIVKPRLLAGRRTRTPPQPTRIPVKADSKGVHTYLQHNVNTRSPSFYFFSSRRTVEAHETREIDIAQEKTPTTTWQFFQRLVQHGGRKHLHPPPLQNKSSVFLQECARRRQTQ